MGEARPDRRLVVVARSASALESLVELVKIGARLCMAGDRRGGSVMREGWAEIWVDRCLWVFGVWPTLDLGNVWRRRQREIRRER